MLFTLKDADLCAVALLPVCSDQDYIGRTYNWRAVVGDQILNRASPLPTHLSLR